MKKLLLTFSIFLYAAPMFAQVPDGHQPRPRAGESPVLERLSDPQIIPAAVTFTDNFDGPNDTTSLKARGYLPYYRGSSAPGISPTWFTGWSFSPYFSAFNGPDTSYVASEYQSVSATAGAEEVDNWLVLPALPVDSGDTISFYCRSPQGSFFLDTVEVMYSAVGDSVPEAVSWVMIGQFQSDTSGMWVRVTYLAPASGMMARFAIRHHVIDGGPQGNGSDYIGIDQLDIIPWNTVGLPSQKPEIRVSVFPNPAVDYLYIKSFRPGVDHIDVFNAIGQSVWHGRFNAGLLDERIDISGWPSGLYLVSVRAGNSLHVEKVLVR